MKTKKFKTKMSLNKATVANLEKPEMNEAKGGYESKFWPCPTWAPDSCNSLCYSVDPPWFCPWDTECDCW